MKSRRDFLARAMGLSAGLAAAPRLLAAEKSTASKDTHPRAAGRARSNVLVETPDVPQLPWRVVDGAKEFHLVAEPVKRRLIPGREMQVWGYNGSCPGPTIQVNQGDRVRVVFENKLPESTSIHWHGLEIPVAMDGMRPFHPFRSPTRPRRVQNVGWIARLNFNNRTLATFTTNLAPIGVDHHGGGTVSGKSCHQFSLREKDHRIGIL